MRGEKQHPVASLLRTSIGGKHWMVTISTTTLPQVGEEEQVFLSYSEGRGPPCSLQPPPQTPSCRASVCMHTFVLFSLTRIAAVELCPTASGGFGAHVEHFYT